MLQLQYRAGRFPAHIFDGVLIAQPVRALDSVVHVPAPIVLAHIAHGRGDAALSSDRMATGWKNFRDTGGLQAGLGRTHGSPQARTARTDHHHIIDMVHNLIGLRHTSAP